MGQPADAEARTYSLTPEQFQGFIGSMPDLASFVHLDAMREGPEAYSTGSIARGNTDDERTRRGLSMRPEDSVASLRRYFDSAGHTTRYTIRTDDPAIQARLRETGIRGQTDEERTRPMRDAMQRAYELMARGLGGRLLRSFEKPPTSEDLAGIFTAVGPAPRQPAYELTPEQFGQLMGREDMRGFVAMDDMVAHTGASGSFGRIYIQPPGPLGRDTIGTAESHFNRFTNRPERYVLTTTDPRLTRALGEMGIQPTSGSRFPQTKEMVDLGNQPGARPPQAERR